MAKPVDKKKMACNKPRRTPSHPKKSHIVKACEGGKEKIIRFGQQGKKVGTVSGTDQKRKDEYKVNALKLRQELNDLERKKDLNKFLKTMQYVLIAMMMITFVGMITLNENAEISVGERMLQLFYERGYLEK